MLKRKDNNKFLKPRHTAPIHVLNAYIGMRIQRGNKYIPEIIAYVLRRKSHDNMTPNNVLKHKNGNIPINTPIEKENASL